jgi:TolB protein
LRRLFLTLAAAGLLAASCGGGSKANLGSGTIAYVSTGGGDYALYLVDAAGGTPRRLTKNPDRGHEDAGTHFQDAPAWSPDGSQLVFDSNRTGTYELYVLDAASGQEGTLGVQGADAAFSPHGKRIVFDGPAGGLSTVAADGTGLRRLTRAGRAELDPSWSPDGRRIAFVRRHRFQGQLWIVGADGRGARQLTQAKADETTPAWSPDGRWIAFSTDLPGTHQIYVIHPDGTGLRRVTVSATDDTDPTWSPDGKRIAYARADGLFIIGADGRGSRQVADGTALNPAWRLFVNRE